MLLQADSPSLMLLNAAWTSLDAMLGLSDSCPDRHEPFLLQARLEESERSVAKDNDEEFAGMLIQPVILHPVTH
jgi:hypothetical protein